MMYFVWWPDTYSYANRLKTVKVCADHRFTLTLQGGDPDPSVTPTLFTGSYEPDNSTYVEIDLTDVVDGYCDINLPNQLDGAQQVKWAVSFIITITDPDEGDSEETQGFSVAAYEYRSTKAQTPPYNKETRGRWLTSQPTSKLITKESMELLSTACLSEGTDDVFVKEINGVSCNYSLISNYPLDNFIKAWIFDVSYAEIKQIVEQLGGTEAIPVANDAEVTSYKISARTPNYENIFTYTVTRGTGREKQFAFVNRQGGIDTILMQGDNILESETEYPIADFCGIYAQRHDDDTDRRIWHQYSGKFDKNWEETLNDFAENRRKYWKVENGSFIPIVLTECSRTFTDRDNLVSFDFKYKKTGAYSENWREGNSEEPAE